MLFKVRPILFVFVVALTSHSTASEYRPPGVHSCSPSSIGIRLGDEDSCLVITGRLRVVGGVTSNGESGTSNAIEGNLALVSTDRAAIVIGAREALEYYLSDYAAPDVYLSGRDDPVPALLPKIESGFRKVWVYEAFFEIGDDVRLRAGLIDAAFSSLASVNDAAEVVGLKSILYPYAASYSSGGNRLTIGASKAPPEGGVVSAAVEGNRESVEVIGRVESPGHARLMGSLAATSAIRSVRMDGWWSDGGGNRVAARGFAATDGVWGVEVSSRLQLGETFFAGLFGLAREGTEGVVTLGLGQAEHGPSISLSSQYALQQGQEGYSRFEARASLKAEDTFDVSLSLGMQQSWGMGNITYARVDANGSWGPRAAALAAETNSLGVWKATGRLQRFIAQ